MVLVYSVIMLVQSYIVLSCVALKHHNEVVGYAIDFVNTLKLNMGVCLFLRENVGVAL